MTSKRVFEGAFVAVDQVLSDRQRAAEVVRTKNGRYSVAFLLYDRASGQVILAEQNRAAMIWKANTTGRILEVPAGRVEPGESPEAVIAREASEEVGAKFDVSQVVMLNGGQPLAVSPGILDEMMYLGYVCLQAGQLVPNREFGLHEEGERIKRVSVHSSLLASLACEDLKTLALVQWFLHERAVTKKGRE